MNRMDWDSLPKTLQDAVRMTCKLQMHYISIDSLCIFQDNGDDWETEAANTGAIYEASLLTISASVASNSTHGIFARRPQPSEVLGTDRSGNPCFAPVRKIVDVLRPGGGTWSSARRGRRSSPSAGSDLQEEPAAGAVWCRRTAAHERQIDAQRPGAGLWEAHLPA